MSEICLKGLQPTAQEVFNKRSFLTLIRGRLFSVRYCLFYKGSFYLLKQKLTRSVYFKIILTSNDKLKR